MKSHAILIAAHAFPELLEDIVNILDASNHYFFIHIDKKSKKMFSTEPVLRLKEKGNVVFLQPMIVNIAGFSQIVNNLRLFEKAFKYENCKIDYFHLISGQDYPCVSNSEFDAIFEHNEKSYMLYDKPEEILEWRKNKYHKNIDYFNFLDLNILFLPHNNIIRRMIIKLMNIIANICKRKPMNNLYAGWDWFSWHRSVVAFLLSFVENNSQFVKRFKHTTSAVEIFFHTILNDHLDQLNIEKYDSLRYIEWYPRGAKTSDFTSKEKLLHPLVLDEREYNDIINSGAIFCRKVHPVQSAKLVTLFKIKK